MRRVADWRDNLVDDDAGLTRILREARRVAVLGAKPHPGEPAFYVPDYLRTHGYSILSVNPVFAGQTLFGRVVVGTLADLQQTADIVEVFRRPQYLPGHAAEILALPWRPAVVWFQLGIRHAAAAERLAEAGIRVVQDRCMMPDHRRLLGAGR
jgi:hypothetical protein